MTHDIYHQDGSIFPGIQTGEAFGTPEVFVQHQPAEKRRVISLVSTHT